jgi:hypothetical protein
MEHIRIHGIIGSLYFAAHRKLSGATRCIDESGELFEG